MDRNTANILADFANGSARDDYSGRGMFGKTTHAVVCHSWDEFVGAVERYNEEIVDEEAGEEPLDPDCFRSDSMGLQIVVY